MFYKTVKGTSACNIQPTSNHILHPYEPAMTNNTESHMPPTNIFIFPKNHQNMEFIATELPLYMQAPSKDLRMDYTWSYYP